MKGRGAVVAAAVALALLLAGPGVASGQTLVPTPRAAAVQDVSVLGDTTTLIPQERTAAYQTESVSPTSSDGLTIPRTAATGFQVPAQMMIGLFMAGIGAIGLVILGLQRRSGRGLKKPRTDS